MALIKLKPILSTRQAKALFNQFPSFYFLDFSLVIPFRAHIGSVENCIC